MTKNEFEQSDDKVEAAHIEAALRDPVGWPKPAVGFAGRCLVAIRAPAAVKTRSPGGRWMKVAASVAAMATFLGLAAVVGRVVLNAPRDEDSGASTLSAARPANAEEHGDMDELDVISQQGDNTMIARKMVGVVGAAVVSVAVSATELTSEPTLVFTRPETSSFWNTATNNVMTVPVDFPRGTTTATLTVRGLGYSATYADIEKGTDSYTFSLPVADSPQAENVYDLELTFNDGTVRRAKLGLIEGLSPDAEGTTRCLAPAEGRVWERVKGRAVLPIPYGTTSFSVTVNGEQRTADTGLNGAQGWYALGVNAGDNVSLSMIANGLSYSGSLYGMIEGFIVIMK